jgi:hypothetical protein
MVTEEQNDNPQVEDTKPVKKPDPLKPFTLESKFLTT